MRVPCLVQKDSDGLGVRGGWVPSADFLASFDQCTALLLFEALQGLEALQGGPENQPPNSGAPLASPGTSLAVTRSVNWVVWFALTYNEYVCSLERFCVGRLQQF